MPHPDTASCPGSPPRAWGTPPARRAPATATRFTPTCVGNTRPSSPRPPAAAVHPHVRGEHVGGRASRSTPVHPHVRGEHAPARTGFPVKTVYPHVRGEHVGTRRAPSARIGSSPRAWGTPRGVLIEASPVHPHVRGEHVPGARRLPGVGSSPRAWGTRVRAHGATASVHPHVRGEHGCAVRVERRLYGSSPRAWGTRHVDRAARLYGSSPRAWGTRGGHAFFVLDERFIPTCVGNTRAVPRISSAQVHPHVRGEHLRPG